MVKHIVFYKLKEDCSKTEAVEKMAELLESLVGVVPGLLWLEVSPVMQGDVDCVLYSEFEGAQELADYAVHPQHVLALDQVRPFIAERIAADYEY